MSVRNLIDDIKNLGTHKCKTLDNDIKALGPVAVTLKKD